MMKIRAVSWLMFCTLCMGACAGLSVFSGANREFEKGLAFFNSGNYGDATPHFLRAVELDPKHTKAHLYLGRTYLNLGQWVQAIQPLRTAYRLSPYDTQKETLNFLLDALLGASVSGIKAGDFQNAIGYLREGLELDSRSEKIKTQLYGTLISYGGKLLSERNILLAIKNYQQAADLMPNQLEAYLGLARAFLQNGELLKAVNSIHRAEKIDPNNDRVQTLLLQLLKTQ